MSAPGYIFGVVKAVLSGDTLVLMGTAKAGPPPELQVTLSSIQAPVASRHPEKTDEPFGWPSREFLRKACIGKAVKFQVEYRRDGAGGSKREFAAVYLADPAAPGGYGENLSKTVVRAGWAKVVRSDGKAGSKSRDYDELLALEAAAAEAGVGLHSKDLAEATASIRNLNWSVGDSTALASDLKGTLQPAILEQVRDGSSYRCLLLNSNIMINFNLAGLQAPKMGRPAGAPAGGAGGDAAPSEPAPFALESKHFVEVRLLHRNVGLRIGGADKYGNLFGVVEHSAGSISVELLKAGLAKMVDWSLSYASPADGRALRAAEKIAKDGRVRVWRDFTPTAIAGERSYAGKVIETVSGDTLVVAVPSGEERRISLASIRAPRLGNLRSSTPAQPYSYEAKEALRRCVIGRDVSVVIEYVRADAPAGGAGGGAAGPERKFATVTLDRKDGPLNLAEYVVSLGLAEVQRHGASDDRSSQYDALLAAEAKAREDKKGMHSPKEPPTRRIADLTADAAKAKTYLPFFQRDGVVPCVVEYVFAGGRVKVFVPKENCEVMLNLAGIRCPALAKPATTGPDGKPRPGREGEPFGEEAFQFMRLQTNQRDAEVEVESMDSQGCAVGQLWVGKGGQRKNIAVELLTRGLASVFAPAASRSRHGDELFAAETDAKGSKRGLWAEYVEEKAAAVEEPAGEELVNVRVCEVVNGSTFFAHAAVDDGKLVTIESKLADMLTSVGTGGAPAEIRKGKLVACLYNDGEGNKWFRARVEGRTRDEEAGFDLIRVTYIDYGNHEDVPVTRIRPLDPAVLSYPPMARECVLALVSVPPLGDDHGRDAAVFLSDNVYGQLLVAKVHARDAQNRLVVTLFQEEDATSVSELLLLEGLGRVSRSEAKKVEARLAKGVRGADKEKALLQRLQAAQAVAKSERKNMWRYGDAPDSEDERR